MYNSYISHSGVKGMKWGVRRYQNEDGTLTEAGRKRYSDVAKEKVGSLVNKSKNSFNKQIERQKSIRSNYKDIKSTSTRSDRFVYNNATRRKAAKYMTDKGMSKEDAVKKAKKDAWRNSAIALAAFGAVSIASVMASNKSGSGAEFSPDISRFMNSTEFRNFL